MKSTLDKLEEKAIGVMTVLVVVAFLVFLALIISWSIIGTRNRENRERICLDAGYIEIKHIAGEWYCVGICDGNSVVEPVDDVRSRLEGE